MKRKFVLNKGKLYYNRYFYRNNTISMKKLLILVY
jgi:hypothetical protein